MASQLPSTAPTPAPRASRTPVWLTLILLLALGLRLWGIEWDRASHLHPDERFWTDVANHVHPPDDWKWSEVLDPEISTLNPRVHKPNYVYGTLPLWSAEAAADVLREPAAWPLVATMDWAGINLLADNADQQPPEHRYLFDTGYHVLLVGRLLSALVDTATVAAVFVLGRELADSRVGLLAALLQSLTVLHIQYSHFLGSEPWVALFVTLVVWGSVRLARGRGGWRTRLGTGVALGLAIASKLSGVAAVAAPVVAAVIVVGPDVALAWRHRGTRGAARLGRVAPKAESWILMALAAVVAYRLAQPYDFEGGASFPWASLRFNERFFADVDYLADINGGGNWPWVQPLVGATPLWHPLKQMFWWGMGPGLGLAALGGAVRAARRYLAGERFWAVPLAVVAAYLVLVATQFYAIVRYLQPAYPALVTLAAAGLVALWRWADRGPVAAVAGEWPRRLGKVVAVGCVGATVFWAGAYVNGVYGNDNARLAASDWVNANLEPGSVLSVQEWDDGVPWGASGFERVTLRPFSFGGDNPESIEALIAGLDQVDYVIETSNKFYDALPRTPARFPQTTAYYRTLFDGSLGFELIETFENRPSLFGITIDDSNAEEAFTLYDHPTVFIWAKTDRFSTDHARALLNPDRARVGVNAIPAEAYANASMLRPDAYTTQQDGSSYAQAHPARPNSVLAAVAWLVLVQVVSWALAPVVLPWAGRGAGAIYGFTKLGALLTLGVPVWLVVSWGWVNLSAWLVWTALVLILAIGGALMVTRLDELARIWYQHRGTIVTAEVIFVGVFLVVLALRAFNPDMWHQWRGGEKPMELAYFTAVTGSTTLPPYDPWFAGGSLNYYYFGWFLLAVPTRLLGIAPDIAFNLGVATFAAVAATAVFSTTAQIAQLADRAGARAGVRSRPGRVSAIGAGLFAVLAFLVLGNLDGARQLWSRWRDPERPVLPFDWWDPSRVLKASPGSEVTEFPAFTVLFADLHPHFMAMGLFGMVLAAALGYVERTRRGAALSGWVLAAGLGALTAVVRMTHTWDLPVTVAVAAAALVCGAVLARGPGRWRAGRAVGHLVVMAIAHLAISAPYRGANQVGDSGFGRSTSVSAADDWLTHWGLFLFIGGFYLVVRLVQVGFGVRPRPFSTTAEPAVSPSRAWGPERVKVTLGMAAAVVVAALFALALSGPVAGLAAMGVVLAGWLLVAELRAADASVGHIMVAGLWMLGFAVMVGVELYTFNHDINRLNTVFKFWLQIWHLFAVAAGFSVAWLLSRSSVGDPRKWRPVFASGVVVLVLAAAVYPVLAVKPRTADRIDTALGPSLQGHLWLEPGSHMFSVRDAAGIDHLIDPGLDRPLIDWLRANVSGRPTIVEAVGGAEYQWWGRMSITTGLPTVLGWRWHQEQQRTLFGYKVNERRADVVEFYTTASPERIDSFLRAYDVAYVIVGSIESTTAAPHTLALFAANPALNPVFRSGDQIIYAVDAVALGLAQS